MTVYQIQCLLGYLGYNPGIIDGVHGNKTAAAIEAFYRDYGNGADLLKAVKGEIQKGAATPSFWERYPNWTREEFRCRCGGQYCNGFPVEPDEKLVALLQKIRDHFGKPCLRESGIRCEVWNAKQGGVSNSRHKYGKAMDFRIQGVDPNEIVSVAKTFPECAYTYAIKRTDGTLVGTVHVDVL